MEEPSYTYEYRGLSKGIGKTQARRIFDQTADVLMEEWGDLQVSSDKPTRRAESPNAWFKRHAYHILGDYIAHGMTSVFRDCAMADRRSHRLVEEATRNPFKLGLLALASDDVLLTRNNRHVFGNQMMYAWIHDVPWDFINAFLAVSGGPAQIAEKLKSKQPEPGFEHRFKRSRLIPDLE